MPRASTRSVRRSASALLVTMLALPTCRSVAQEPEQSGDRRRAQGESPASRPASQDDGSRAQDTAGEQLDAILEKLTAGHDGTFYLSDRDGNFRLEFHTLAQFRYIGNIQQQSGQDTGFEVAALRPAILGHAGSERLRFFVQGEFNDNDDGDGFLLDATATYDFGGDPYTGFSLMAGQYRLPFSREQLLPLGSQLAVDRSIVNFALDLGAAGGRSQGIDLDWRNETSNARVSFSDGRDAINSAFDAGGTDWAVTARFEQVVFGERPQFTDLTSPCDGDAGLQLGASVHGEDRFFGWTADAHLETAGAVLYGQLTSHTIYDTPIGRQDLFGAVVQSGVRVLPETEVFGRYEYGDDDLSEDDLQLVLVGVNHYFAGQQAKVTADFGYAFEGIPQTFAAVPLGYRADAPGEEDQFVFRVQLQLAF